MIGMPSYLDALSNSCQIGRRENIVFVDVRQGSALELVFSNVMISIMGNANDLVVIAVQKYLTYVARSKHPCKNGRMRLSTCKGQNRGGAYHEVL